MHCNCLRLAIEYMPAPDVRGMICLASQARQRSWPRKMMCGGGMTLHWKICERSGGISMLPFRYNTTP